VTIPDKQKIIGKCNCFVKTVHKIAELVYAGILMLLFTNTGEFKCKVKITNKKTPTNCYRM